MMSAKYSISGEFIICCVSRSFCRFEIVPLLPFIDDFLLAETLIVKFPHANIRHTIIYSR